MIRAEVFYTGRVQGVGFRWRTLRIAQRHAVTGTVRNLRDGRVELIAEGEREVVDAFLDAVLRDLGALVRDTEVTFGAAAGTFPSFGVVR